MEQTLTEADKASKKALDELFECLDTQRHFRLEAGAGAGKNYSLITLDYKLEPYKYKISDLVNGGDHAMTNMLALAAIILVIVILIVIIVLMERAQLRIPIHYSKKASGARYSAHLPLKINSAGVIPVIFASSFITTPQMIFSFVTVDRTNPWMDFLVQLFDYQTVYGVIFYTVLLIAFTYFYSLISPVINNILVCIVSTRSVKVLF